MRTLEGQAPSLPAARLQAILFEHDDVMYALDARAVVEILWLPELSPVVQMPHFVVGVMNYRGRTLPVVDLLRRVGRASAPYQVTDQLVVVESRDGLYAIIVEMVRDVVSIDPDDVQPTEALSSGGVSGSRVISHAINRESAVVMLLDPDAILPPPGSAWSDDRPSADPFPSRLEHLPVDARATLRERATELAARPDSDDEEDALALAIIRIGDDWFGIDVSTVEQFARCPAHITPVPCTPDHVRGATTFEGDVLTLVDVSTALDAKLGEISPTSRVAVIRQDDFHVGALVDDVEDIVFFKRAAVRDVEGSVLAANHSFLRGVVEFGDGIIGVLDLLGIVTQEDWVVDERVI